MFSDLHLLLTHFCIPILYSLCSNFLRSFWTFASLFSDISCPSMSQVSWTSVLQLMILGPLLVCRNAGGCQLETKIPNQPTKQKTPEKNSQRLLHVQANSHQIWGNRSSQIKFRADTSFILVITEKKYKNALWQSCTRGRYFLKLSSNPWNKTSWEIIA